jgi:hypothetical protein
MRPEGRIWSLANNVVAYVGCDCFDIILYLSRILQRLGKKVLIIDYSECGSIKYGMPSIDGLDSRRDIITYRKVDYTSKKIDIKEAEDYDDIIISCGFNTPLDLSSCSHIVCVSDLFRFNQERLAALYRVIISSVKERSSLLIRNMIYSRTSGILCDSLTEAFDNCKVSFLYNDERDYENSLKCSFGGIIRFFKISKYLKSYLIKEIISLYPDTDMKKLRKVVKRAAKGS